MQTRARGRGGGGGEAADVDGDACRDSALTGYSGGWRDGEEYIKEKGREKYI